MCIKKKEKWTYHPIPVKTCVTNMFDSFSHHVYERSTLLTVVWTYISHVIWYVHWDGRITWCGGCGCGCGWCLFLFLGDERARARVLSICLEKWEKENIKKSLKGLYCFYKMLMKNKDNTNNEVNSFVVVQANGNSKQSTT